MTPKFVSPSDPAAQWTGALRNAAFFAYADNYLIDVKFGVIMDVEASRAIRQAEVGASRTMIERTEACFGIKPDWLAADTAYGSAPNLDWLVKEKAIAPHVPVIDKSKREDGTFSREDFIYDKARDIYTCPAGRKLLEEREHVAPLQLATDDDTAAHVDAMNLKHRLSYVEANCRDCQHDELLRILVASSATNSRALARPVEEPSTASLADMLSCSLWGRRRYLEPSSKA